ncbi:hypothetical protein SNEBB_003881 [Seison nebaliae]|nr:hypothetical protein SNEBB_003881 [Seison nebaliae]
MKEIRLNGFVLNYKKCEFAKTECLFLGHMLSENGIELAQSKVDAIRLMPPPKSKKEKNIQMKWTKIEESARQKLIELLAKTPILRHPNYKKLFIISTDASKSAISGVLQQNDNFVYNI